MVVLRCPKCCAYLGQYLIKFESDSQFEDLLLQQSVDKFEMGYCPHTFALLLRSPFLCHKLFSVHILKEDV